jgi:hypothetical protein
MCIEILNGIERSASVESGIGFQKERKKQHRENVLGENQLLGIVGMAATDAADRASTAATREFIGAES